MNEHVKLRACSLFELTGLIWKANSNLGLPDINVDLPSPKHGLDFVCRLRFYLFTFALMFSVGRSVFHGIML